MQTIVTAAGDSIREFLQAGFELPKSLIEVDGQTVIERAIRSFRQDNGPLVVAINRDEEVSFDISQTVRRASVDARVVQVSSSVMGALATAVLASEEIDLQAPLLISAGDSEVIGGVSKHIEALQAKNSDAGTVVFQSSNPRWSYISTGEAGQVLEVAEKVVTGSYATIGCFYFRTGELFLDAAQWVFTNNANLNERFYVSTSLNYLISKNFRVNYEVIPRHHYRSFATPMDLLGKPTSGE